MTRQLRPRRLHGDRGVVLVEAVFLFPIVVFITLAILEYGLLFASQSTTQSSTRQGVRFAAANFAVAADKNAASDQIKDEVTKALSALTGYDRPIQLLVYKSNDTGDPVSGTLTACTGSCFHYTWNGTAFVNDTPAAQQWTNPQGCISSTLDSIGIYVEVQHSYITGAFGTSQLMKEHTVSRLEPLPLIQCP